MQNQSLHNSMTFAIGADVIGVADSNNVSCNDIVTGCQKAWKRYGATHFSDATLAGLSIMVERTLQPEQAAPLLEFLSEAMAANDRIQAVGHA